MAELCRLCGRDIGHEEMSRDGVSSWMMGPPVWRVPFHRRWQHKGRNWYTFDRVIVVVREPIAHIASVAFTENFGEIDRNRSRWWRSHWSSFPIDDNADTVTVAALSIVHWYANLREWFPDADTVRLEDAAETLPRLLGSGPVESPGVVNARPHEALSWREIESRCGGEVSALIREHARLYGYTMPEGSS